VNNGNGKDKKENRITFNLDKELKPEILNAPFDFKTFSNSVDNWQS
jgi:hypothetical protein